MHYGWRHVWAATPRQRDHYHDTTVIPVACVLQAQLAAAPVYEVTVRTDDGDESRLTVWPEAPVWLLIWMIQQSLGHSNQPPPGAPAAPVAPPAVSCTLGGVLMPHDSTLGELGVEADAVIMAKFDTGSCPMPISDRSDS